MFERRLKYVAIAGSLFFVVIGLRLCSMQVFSADHWRAEAARLAKRRIVLPARRGTIFDRHGTALAQDRLEYDITVRLDRYDDHPWRCSACGRPVYMTTEREPRRCPGCAGEEFERGDRIDWSMLPPLLGLPAGDIRERLAAAWKELEASVRAVLDSSEGRRERDVRRAQLRREWTLYRNVDMDAVREVTLDPARYRGLAISPVYRRVRTEDEYLSRLVGNLRQLNKEEGERLNAEGVKWTTLWRVRVGKFGLEAGFEDVLGSWDGWREVDRDRRGRVREVLAEEPARHGEDVTLSLDIPLQKKMEGVLAEAVRAHGAKGGAFVAMDPRTGEVLVLADHAEPGLDTGGVPLTLTHVMPGSVYKVVTAFAGLESGTLDPSELFTCSGRWHNVGCHDPHGVLDLADAIRLSCNGYFARVADPERMPIEVFNYWAEMLGFGQRTGIELSGESPGYLPTRERRRRLHEAYPERFPHAGLDRGELWRAGFGQGLVDVTPIQVAHMMSMVANGGREVAPTLRLGGGKPGEQVLTPAHVTRVRAALRAVVTDGTGKRTGLDRFRAAGKTGTADIQAVGSRHYAWFAGYAPAENPRFAFACYLRDTSAYGGDAAGPVVHAFLTEVMAR